MSVALTALLLTATLASASPAAAVERARVAACLQTADLVQRLACYDGLGRPPASVQAGQVVAAVPGEAGDYPTVDLIDLKVDRDRLVGRGVTTAGRLNVSGQLAFLRTQGIDNTPLHVSIARLPAETQKEIRARCASACSATIKGKVVHVTLGLGLAAEDVSISSATR